MRITSPNNQIVWKSGDHWAICDQCGFKFLRSEMKKQWNNLIVCKQDFEERQPQDFVKAHRDQITVYDTRTEGEDQFITTPVEPGDL